LAKQLIHLQLALECIGLDGDGLLVRIPGPDPDVIARVYAYRHAGGHSLYFRRDVSPAVRAALTALGAEVVFHDQDQVRSLLALDAACDQVNAWHTYTFPQTFGSAGLGEAIQLQESHRALIEAYSAGMDVTRRAVYAIIRDGQIVSTCGSVRKNEQAGECYTYTLAAYRGRGYGRQVTAAWGVRLVQQGKVAFYSHLRENSASRSVAQGLGLEPCFAGVAYS